MHQQVSLIANEENIKSVGAGFTTCMYVPEPIEQHVYTIAGPYQVPVRVHEVPFDYIWPGLLLGAPTVHVGGAPTSTCTI